MPNWKKVITSGSNASLNQITASSFQFVGSGTAELEVKGNITASGDISASGTGYFKDLYLTENTPSLTLDSSPATGDATIQF